VGPVTVVLVDEDSGHSGEMPSAEDEKPVERDVRAKRSATALAFGARTGVRMISSPSPRKAASNSRVHLLSRSRIRKRNGSDRSVRVQANWRGLLG
jgi:hypothetical protein